MLIGETVFESRVCNIGRFRCPVTYPRFRNTGPIGRQLMVFPRTSVVITHAGADPVVADPNVVMLYNPGQEYTRDPISARGDRCEFFAPAPDVLAEAIRPFDPGVEARCDRPFTTSHAPCSAATYALQRALYERARRREPIEAMEYEELVLTLVRHVVEGAHRAQGRRPARIDTRRAHRELAEAAKATLASSFGRAWTLDALARAVYSSAHHLCRVFARETGMTVHAYLDQLRLRSALERLADGERDLSLLAAELGYSSHSHFAHAFRSAFDMTPSAYRARPTALARLK